MTSDRPQDRPSTARDSPALYAAMFLIRRFEETLLDLFSQREDRRHDPHLHRPGGERGRRGSRARPGRDVIVSNHRCHGHYLAFTDDVDGLLREVMGRRGRRLRRQGRQPAPLREQLLLERRARQHRPARHRDRARRARARRGRRLDRVHRRRHARSGRRLREPQHRLAVAAAAARTSSSTTTTRSRRRRSLQLAGDVEARAAAFGVATERLDTTDVPEIRAARRAAVAHVRDDRDAVLPRPRHVPLQPAQQGRRLPRPGRDRRPPRARPAHGRPRPRTSPRTPGARSRRPARPARRGGRAGARRASSPRSSRGESGALRPGAERAPARDLRGARRRLPARRGHARPLRRRLQDQRRGSRPAGPTGCSRRRSARRRSSASPPASRCAATGRSSRSCSATSSRSASTRSSTGSRSSARCSTSRRDRAARRADADGRRAAATGRRTASRSRSCCSAYRASRSSRRASATTCGALLAEAVADDEPVFFIENKLMYGRPNRRPVNGCVGRVPLPRERRVATRR